MRSLVTKLTLAFLLVGLTGSILVAVAIRQRTRTAFDEFLLNREQQALVDGLLDYYQVNGSWAGVTERLVLALEQRAHLLDGRQAFRQGLMPFSLVGPDRQVIFSLPRGREGQRLSELELGRAVPLEVDGEQAGWLLLASARLEWIPDSPEARFLRTVNVATLFSALVAGLLALVLGGMLAFTLTRSLRELTEATQEIAGGKLGKQVKVRSQDELGDLAASFNQMSRDLERATQARRQMTADIAHDLRSPLSVIAGYSEALSEEKLSGSPEVYAILHRETLLLSRLVEDLRTLSLADAGELPLNRQALAPQALLEQVAARHAVAAHQKDISIKVEAAPATPPVFVDAERMTQVLDNLVINALRYTPAEGDILLATLPADGGVLIQIRDSGSGMDQEEQLHIFDRLYRGDKVRQQNGESGLGLAIAKSIVEAHGGTISVESWPRQGSLFNIRLPALVETAK